MKNIGAKLHVWYEMKTLWVGAMVYLHLPVPVGSGSTLSLLSKSSSTPSPSLVWVWGLVGRPWFANREVFVI